ncbi:MAG: DUF1772 domain-containing protein [Parvibaculaceae bacterium]
MVDAFHIFALLVVSVAMALSLAHALELPGKLRLPKDSYFEVQKIYYPGFTFGGLVGEAGGLACLLVLLLMTSTSDPAFPWIVASFVLLLAVQAVYWLITHPVNSAWLKGTDLARPAGAFFSLLAPASENRDWTSLRDTWEHSHVARAVLSMLSLASLAIALAR